MFKRRAVGQRIFLSEMASFNRAGSNDDLDSISADPDYLHHVGDEERKGYANGEQAPSFQYPGPLGFSAAGYMSRRLSLRR